MEEPVDVVGTDCCSEHTVGVGLEVTMELSLEETHIVVEVEDIHY
jgi:hypothetical protein